MEKTNQELKNLTSVVSTITSKYKFIRAGQMRCSIDHSFSVPFGNTMYASPTIKMLGSILLKDWVFCLEQHNGQETYFFSAFFGDEHYTFGTIKGKTLQEAQTNFMSACLLDMCPFLFREEVLALEKKHGSDASFDWDEVLDNPKDKKYGVPFDWKDVVDRQP